MLTPRWEVNDDMPQGRAHASWLKPIYLVLAMLAGGTILGSTEALLLHRSIPIVRWIVATVAGFGIVAVTIQWPLIALGVLGAIPGPVEPLIITVGGGSFAGICQYWTLRRHGFRARKWLLLGIGGLIAGVVPTALLMISLGTLRLAPSWSLEVFLNGFIIAGVAAWISGKALFAVFSEASPTAPSEVAV